MRLKRKHKSGMSRVSQMLKKLATTINKDGTIKRGIMTNTDIIKELKEALLAIKNEEVFFEEPYKTVQRMRSTAKTALAKLEAWEQTKLPELPKRYTGMLSVEHGYELIFNQLITCMEAVYKQLEKKI